MYETPLNVLSRSNGVESPVAYATTTELRYMKHTDVAQVMENSTVTSSLQEDLKQHSSTISGIAEPQMYETVVNLNGHNPPGAETPMYEEPRDSILRYERSQEADEAAQQPYEVPICTSLREDQVF